MAIVGIDLGTTNSLVATIEKGRPVVIPSETGNPLIPSVVRFDKAGELESVGEAAKKSISEHWDRTIFSAKRFIGRGKKDVESWVGSLPFNFSNSDDQMVRFTVGQKSYTPIEISSFILKELKKLAEKKLGKAQQAVITVPAYFNDAQRQATKFAGELAGLDVVRIINEPTAACLAYGLDKKAKGIVAVFDLGGGTFDISILKVSEGIVEVLATNGNTALGGDDFDHAIAEGIFQTHSDLGKREWARLLVQAELIKRQLTDSESVTTDVLGKTITVTRSDIAKWTQPILERAKAPVLQCIEDSKFRLDQITDVILVGGSTRMPVVKEFVKTLFKREPICSLDPDLVVAMGAAVQANILDGKLQGMLLLDVIPLSLGIETMGGVVSKLIPRNSTIPISAAEQFSTYVDGQVNVDIHVLQGERELVQDNRSLARFQMKGLPPLPAGVPKIEVEFIVDANGILSVRATELRTGVMASVSVNPSYGLTDNEVEKMLSDSFEHAESDFKLRFLREAQTEADSIIRATEKSLTKGKHLIDADEAKRIEDAVKKVRASMSATDHQVIKNAIEELNTATLHLAEEVLNEAVRGALSGKDLS